LHTGCVALPETIAKTLAEAKLFLQNANVEAPALDANVLLAEALNLDHARLLLKANEIIDGHAYARYQSWLRQRAEGICAAYITGHKEFRYLDLIVTPDVLVPRPDTETLVDAALEYIDAMRGDDFLLTEAYNGEGDNYRGGGISALDLCSGSGALALSLASERNFLNVWASDISQAALDVARRNAKKYSTAMNVSAAPNVANAPSTPEAANISDITNRVHFVASDLFDAWTNADGNAAMRFDIIVSNPPYIPSDMIATLAKEVQNEPRIALDGGSDGLVIIRRIIAEANKFLKSGGALLLEADPSQMDAIAVLMQDAGFHTIKIYKDLAGMPRVIAAFGK
jgi:release factor glutamine methyltransferase